MKPRIEISVPEYFQDKTPDYQRTGKSIDEEIVNTFPDRKIVVRYLSTEDHKEKTPDELVDIIEDTGTDRYDMGRRMSVAHDFYADKGVELFAVKADTSRAINITPETLKDFNEGALEDRGYSLKTDVVVIYDAEQLEMIPIQYNDGVGEDAFRFKHPDKKAEAVLGFVILRGSDSS